MPLQCIQVAKAGVGEEPYHPGAIISQSSFVAGCEPCTQLKLTDLGAHACIWRQRITIGWLARTATAAVVGAATVACTQ